MMCTLVCLRRPGHVWPLLVAGNRDEMPNRPWIAPGRHWEDRPEIVAGLDELGEGSWLGVNDHGLVAAVMNREGTLGPMPGKRSRGELVLEGLDHTEAREAANALADIDPRAYRPFNVFLADAVSAFWLRSCEGCESVEVFEIAAGLHMLSARELDDRTVPRIRLYLPKFRKSRPPDPDKGDWKAWKTLLANRLYPVTDGPSSAMNLNLSNGVRTVCSHLVAIPRYPGFEKKPMFLFANGPPDQTPFELVTC